MSSAHSRVELQDVDIHLDKYPNPAFPLAMECEFYEQLESHSLVVALQELHVVALRLSHVLGELMVEPELAVAVHTVVVELVLSELD